MLLQLKITYPFVVKSMWALIQNPRNAAWVSVEDKTKSPGVASHFIHHENAVFEIAVLRKVIPHRVFCGFSGNSSNEHFSGVKLKF